MFENNLRMIDWFDAKQVEKDTVAGNAMCSNSRVIEGFTYVLAHDFNANMHHL